MNRSKAGARLSAYLEGDLSESERSQLESSLADDPTLRETLREIEDVVSALRELPEPELPAAFATRVIARVQEESEQAPGGVRAWIQRIFEPAVAVPLAAGITAFALVIGSQQGLEPVPDAGGEGTLQAAVVDLPRSAPPAPAEASPAITELASAPESPREMTLTELQRLTLQTILSRHRHEDLARLLRGSGHPHAASFANEMFETGPNLQVVSLEQRRGGARR